MLVELDVRSVHTLVDCIGDVLDRRSVVEVKIILAQPISEQGHVP